MDHIEADGLLHRCGTLAKPNGQDGAYKVFLDDPASLWWQNWQTGDSGTFCVNSEKRLTPTELGILKRRTTEARAERERETIQRHAEAAERSRGIWDTAKPATDRHVYLQKKALAHTGCVWLTTGG